jgi:valyl-tRNA synthetase
MCRADKFQPSGEESLAEKWLIHKYNHASGVINDALEAREFADASSAAHHYFLHEFCDIFIVRRSTSLAA